MLTAELGLDETAEVELVQHPFESWIRHCARCENGEDPVRWGRSAGLATQARIDRVAAESHHGIGRA
jgi:hypothetical protein